MFTESETLKLTVKGEVGSDELGLKLNYEPDKVMKAGSPLSKVKSKGV